MQTKPHPPKRGIPTATNVDHIGWTVTDLDAAVAFCVDVLGGAELFRAGPFADPAGDWMARQFDVHPRASAMVAMVRLGATQVVEFLAWETPEEERSEWPRTSDPGATHLAIHVGDVGAAMGYLEAHGCSACGDPVLLTDVPQAGITILYVRTPIGLYLELVSHPGYALSYEEASVARLLPNAPEWRNE
jgi:catechol 2,3-dioxygenase-like lactoylglutathione lyase family enzyme